MEPIMTDATYKCMGFLFGKYRSVDPEDYSDFRYKTWLRIEIVSDLRLGVLPSGMLLRSPSGQPLVVLNRKLCPLDESFRIMQ